MVSAIKFRGGIMAYGLEKEKREAFLLWQNTLKWIGRNKIWNRQDMTLEILAGS